MVAARLPVVPLGLPVESVHGWVLLQRLHTALVHVNVNIPLARVRLEASGS